MAETEPQDNPAARNLEEIDAYGHRALMKRVAKERALAEKNGNSEQEKLLRSLLQDLDKHKKEFESSPAFAKTVRNGFKQILQTGVLDLEQGTVSVAPIPPQAPSQIDEAPAKPKLKTASERAAEIKAARNERLAKISAALEARQQGVATKIPQRNVPPPVEVPSAAEAAGVVEPLVEAPAAKVEPTVVPGAAKVRGRLGMLRSKPVVAGIAALAGLSLIRNLNKKPADTRSATSEFETRVMVERSKEIAKLLENARLERAVRENQMRLARGNPDLYTSVMAGRRVPKGSVVLGGVPRQDLMRELAASMDSGRYAPKDPLSDLMG